MSVWLGLGSGNWAASANWMSNSVPNAIGAVADFSNLAGAAVTHAINLQLVGKTVGTISLASSAIENYSIQSGTLIMQVASGNAAINVTASGAAPLPTIFAPTLTLFLASPTVVTTHSYAGGFATLDIQGQISGSASLTALGAGTLKLSHANSSWTGNTFITQSDVVINNANAFGSGQIFFNGAGVLETSASFTLANAISITATHQAAIRAANGTTLTLTGAFSNLGNTLFFGDAQNTGAIVFSSSAVTTPFVPTGVINLDGGVLRDAAGLNLLLSGANSLNIASGATLDLGAGGYSVNNLSGTGQIFSHSGQTTLELHYDSNVNFGGVISDGTGTVSLIKFGPGNAQPFITGVNTYTGATSIAEGSLTLAGAGSIANSSHVYTNPNATFDISFISAAAANIMDLTHAGHVRLAGKTLNILHQTGDLGGFFDGSVATDGLAVTMAATLANFSLSAAFFGQWTDGTDTITITGNALDNVIIGSSHADRMIGGLGSDSYYVDSALDVTDESTGGGAADSVFSSVSFTAAAGIEQLTLTGAGDINGTGRDAQNDALIGNGGLNQLFGFSGDDALYGLGGGDQLYGGAGNDYLSGGDQADYMSGGAGGDTFFGGAGADTIIGGAGDDKFYILAGDGGDIIVDYVGEGNDRILSSISYSLSSGSEIETLSTDANIGTVAINLTGNTLDNIIIGNNGVNVLDGGLGNDTLYGLGGAVDYFAFSTVANTAANSDTIADWSSAGDLIFLDDAGFTGMAAGALSVSAFLSGAGLTAAATAAQRVVVNTTNGDLWWDQDGVGGIASVRFASVGAGQAVFYYDFFGI